MAFELRKFAGCSQREIAQRMGISECTVEKHLVKALKIIMETMTSPFAEEQDRRTRSDEARGKKSK
jgi:RNA polymerase sigma-70 factor (ECF subfamily)